MAKPVTTQWDFGDLFTESATRRVFSVAELTGDIRRLLEKNIGQAWVVGEITNCRVQSSGHIYFTLKDSSAQLSCVLFRNDPMEGREQLRDGSRVIVKGEMTVYEQRGQYQMRILAVEAQGIGMLHAAFEKLKNRLAAEGLFALARKRALPPFPQRIGLITSATGAAIRDVLHVFKRRNPALEIILMPCQVQGPGAAGDLAAAIVLLNQWSAALPPNRALDLILLTRGGGSLEDLWAFNEEAVARAIYKSALPVVSAVGHEIDFTISDFTADLRAATPSAAAEILTEGVFASRPLLLRLRGRMQERLRRRVQGERRHLLQLAQRAQAGHPRRRLQQQSLRVDELQLTLARSSHRLLEKHRRLAQNLNLRLDRLRPAQLLVQRRDALARACARLQEKGQMRLHQLRQRERTLSSQLRLLGPEQVLARGYSITQDAASGEIIRRQEQAPAGTRLKTKLQHGSVNSTVRED